MKTLGRFELVGKLGQGAMGVVYKARDPLIGRLVALKVITTGLADDPALLDRFYQEARAAGALQHPNIVTIFELGQENGTPFIAMEYLNGQSLDALIAARTALPLSQKLEYIVNVCRALEYAHKRGVVHRDIKPANVMVTTEDAVKLVDFGIARIAENSKSQSGMLIGTLAYMSPQMIQGARADEKSDIWAAGVMFYELLAYRRPFDAENPGALMVKIMQEEIPPLSQEMHGIPANVFAVVSRMLQKDLAQRFQSMEQALIEIEAIRRRLRNAELTVLLMDGRQLLASGKAERAHQTVRRVLEVDSENEEAKKLLEQIHTELRARPAPPASLSADDTRPAVRAAAAASWSQSSPPRQDVSSGIPADTTFVVRAAATPWSQVSLPEHHVSSEIPLKDADSPATVAAAPSAVDVKRSQATLQLAPGHVPAWRRPLLALSILSTALIVGSGTYLLTNHSRSAAASAGSPADKAPFAVAAPASPGAAIAPQAGVYREASADRAPDSSRQELFGKRAESDASPANPAIPNRAVSVVNVPLEQAPPPSVSAPQVIASNAERASPPVASPVVPPAPAVEETVKPANAILSPAQPTAQPVTKTLVAAAEPAPAIVPSKSAEPAPAPAPPAVEKVAEDPERQAISASLAELSAAFSHRSMTEMETIWPKMGANKRTIKDAFDATQSLTREFRTQSVNIASGGMTATVVGTYDGKIRDARGVEKQSAGNFYVRLDKKNGKWYVADASF